MAKAEPEIVKIIKACGLNGVKMFKQGDLEIHFIDEEAQADPPVFYPQATPRPMEVDDEFRKEHEEIIREQQLAELMITDPVLYEAIIAEGQDNAESV